MLSSFFGGSVGFVGVGFVGIGFDDVSSTFAGGDDPHANKRGKSTRARFMSRGHITSG
jgi:hypothetical protein